MARAYASQLAEADLRTLLEELQTFQLRTVSLAADPAVEWRERPHDDLVLAVAIAVWQAELYRPFWVWVFPDPDPEPPPQWWRPW